MTSAIELQRAYAQALLVDRQALANYQQANDALMAQQTLKRAFTTDVQPILARSTAEGRRHRSDRRVPTQRLPRGLRREASGDAELR